MKANSTLAVLQTFAEMGCGFDIVSGGELKRVLAIGGDPARVVFSGVGKTPDEMRFALATGVRCFNVESESELLMLSDLATQMQRRAPISLRVNPDVDAKTHPYISTGLRGNKFGVAHDRAVAVYRARGEPPGHRRGRHRLPHRLANHRWRTVPGGSRSPARPCRSRRA